MQGFRIGIGFGCRMLLCKKGVESTWEKMV